MFLLIHIASNFPEGKRKNYTSGITVFYIVGSGLLSIRKSHILWGIVKHRPSRHTQWSRDHVITRPDII